MSRQNIILEVKNPETVIDYQVKTLVEVNLPGLCSLIPYEDGSILKLKYMTENLMSLAEYLQDKKVDGEFYRHLLLSIVHIIKGAEEYLLPTNQYLLSLEHIFIHPDSKEIRLIFFPVIGVRDSSHNLYGLIKALHDLPMKDDALGISYTLIEKGQEINLSVLSYELFNKKQVIHFGILENQDAGEIQEEELEQGLPQLKDKKIVLALIHILIILCLLLLKNIGIFHSLYPVILGVLCMVGGDFLLYKWWKKQQNLKPISIPEDMEKEEFLVFKHKEEVYINFGE